MSTDTQLALSASNGIQIKTFEDALKLAEYIAKSPFKPKGFENAGDVLIALQCGMELGLPPLAGLQNIAVINGRPGIYGDAALAVVRASGLLEQYKEEIVGEGDEKGVKVTVKRRNFEPATETFTVKDAKTAGLWDKAGPWKQYPKRMLMFRARGFLLRDQFGDVLKGFRTTEELADYTEEELVERAKPVEQSVAEAKKKVAELKQSNESEGKDLL